MGLFGKRTDSESRGSGSVTVASAPPGAIKQALNQSGWIDGEVIAAGQLRQGKAPSMAALVAGTALIELARPRRSNALPRHFVLAATADRVVAFKASSLVMGEETGPELIQIKPGQYGAWPRASVRLSDLPDGAVSKGGTLELAGAEQFPVARPNFGGDPNTDELFELLGGLSSGSPAMPDQHELWRTSEVRAGDPDELAADARRGRPDVDLDGWARRRGLSFRGCAPQGGHLGVTCPWSEDLLFNVVRGRWPGGTYGVVCHEVRLFDLDTAGYFHGGEEIGPRGSVAGFLLDAIVPLPVGGGRSFFKVPYTCAGARVPHLATLAGLHVPRVADRSIGADPPLGCWSERTLDGLGARRGATSGDAQGGVGNATDLTLIRPSQQRIARRVECRHAVAVEPKRLHASVVEPEHSACCAEERVDHANSCEIAARPSGSRRSNLPSVETPVPPGAPIG